MRRILAALLILVTTPSVWGISGGYEYYVFYTSEGQPYLELYYWIEGNSITYKNIEDEKKQGQLEVLIMISPENSDSVFTFDKYKLNTLKFNTSDSLVAQIYDVKRLPLPEGVSYMEIFIKDLNNNEQKFNSKDTLEVKGEKDGAFFSQIQLIDLFKETETENLFSKGGYDILPYHGNFYASDQTKLNFYTEILNSANFLGENGKYILNLYIENTSTGLQLEKYSARKLMRADNYTPLLTQFPIEGLPPGWYNFVVEIRDSLNRFVAKTSTVIERENFFASLSSDGFRTISVDETWASTLDVDSLYEYVHCLRPICEGNEYQYVKNLLKENDPDNLRKFLYAFWTNRYPDTKTEPYKSYSEFKTYNNLVEMVNDEYGTLINKGYLTDRGRVFLRYGVPNIMNRVPFEPNAYPYEIWTYNQLRSQTMVRFVFYNDDMVSNDYRLLHSDLRGEVQNRQWEIILHSRNNTWKGDDNSPVDTYGNWSRDLYNNPR